MKSFKTIFALLLLGAAPLWAQLAVSHNSTARIQQPGSTTSLVVVGKPVVRVNGTALTDRDLLREMYAIFPYARQHGGGFPKAMENDIRSGALKMIVFEELVYQEAERRKMTVPPAKMQRALASFRKQFSSQQEYQAFLKSEVHGSQAELKAKIRRSLLIDALLKQEITSKASVTPLQARAYYDKNPQKFRIPESFAFQTISVIPPDKATPDQLNDVRKRAESALRQAKATKSYEEFGMLAEKISEDDYRVMMGDHRAVDRTKLPPEVLQAAARMKPGDVSDLLKLGNAYCIFRLNAHIPEGKAKFADVKDGLRKRLQQNKTEELRAALGAKLRKNAKIEEL